MGYILIAAAIFGLCFLVDKLFTKLFRSKAQHKSGLTVRAGTFYLGAGVVLLPVGVVALGTAVNQGELWFILASGTVILAAIAFLIWYISFGIYYDGESFLYSRFGKKEISYSYKDIRGQQLYQSGRVITIELYMTDGSTIHLQSNMKGVYLFLDKAFEGWCRQKGIDPAGCAFHDPANSCWFPTMEE